MDSTVLGGEGTRVSAMPEGSPDVKREGSKVGPGVRSAGQEKIKIKGPGAADNRGPFYSHPGSV